MVDLLDGMDLRRFIRSGEEPINSGGTLTIAVHHLIKAGNTELALFASNIAGCVSRISFSLCCKFLVVRTY